MLRGKLPAIGTEYDRRRNMGTHSHTRRRCIRYLRPSRVFCSSPMARTASMTALATGAMSVSAPRITKCVP